MGYRAKVESEYRKKHIKHKVFDNENKRGEMGEWLKPQVC